MENDDRKAALWTRLDELHGFVNLMSAEQARLRAAGAAEPFDYLAEKERLIEEADKVLAELQRFYNEGCGEGAAV